MGTGTRTVAAEVESAVVDLGNTLLADSVDLRDQLSNQVVTVSGFYREVLQILYGLCLGGLDFTRLRQEAVGSTFETTARRIRGELDATVLIAAYESLLQMKLNVDKSTWEVALVEPATDHDRKSGGSYFTPEALVRRILDWTLDPAIGEALDADEPERALLDLKILDPACGSGHFLTVAADRVGLALATLRTARPDPSAEEVERARRDVVRCCIYGVDIDPIAVEICKFALSSSSQNHRICCGNSLLGSTPRQLAEGDSADTGFQPFNWHLEFPQVFNGGRTNPETGWSGGFDVIVGNPPFLNQLATSTAQPQKTAAFLKRRYPGVAGGYADTAAVFAELASQLVRPEGGRIGLVQPASILASADAGGARRNLAERGNLETLWIAAERAFEASVQTCAVVLRNGPETVSELQRFKGLDFSELAPLRVDRAQIRGMDTWAPLIAEGFGIPRVDLDQSRTLGEVLTATADFRDQYYGLAPFVEEADGSEPDGARWAALVTVGLIEPAELVWAKRPTRFNKVRYEAPIVDLDRLRAESDLGEWAANRLVPKLLLATQTRVVEVVVDEAGVLLPSVPVITVTTRDISLWHAAAALMSPPITAWAAARYMGAALSIDGLKLSASQVQNLPMPSVSADWDAAAELTREASGSASPPERTQRLIEAGALMCRAYGVTAADQLMAWWTKRLTRERPT